jgi:hypothetical protein
MYPICRLRQIAARSFPTKLPVYPYIDLVKKKVKLQGARAATYSIEQKQKICHAL